MNHTVFGQDELIDVDIDWKKYLSEESSYVIYTPAGYFYFFYRICHSVGDSFQMIEVTKTTHRRDRIVSTDGPLRNDIF